MAQRNARRGRTAAALVMTGLRGQDRAGSGLPDPEEARPRPVGAGDPGGDPGQRRIAIAGIVEAVFMHDDGVHVAAPLAHQPRAGFERDPRIEGAGALALDLAGDSAQMPTGGRSEPAMGSLLKAVSDRPDYQVAAHRARRLVAMEPAPGDSEVVR